LEDYKLFATSKSSLFKNGMIIQERYCLRSPLCKKICPISSNCCEKLFIALCENKKSLDARLKRINEKIITKSKKPLTLLEELVKNADKEKPSLFRNCKVFFLGSSMFWNQKN